MRLHRAFPRLRIHALVWAAIMAAVIAMAVLPASAMPLVQSAAPTGASSPAYGTNVQAAQAQSAKHSPPCPRIAYVGKRSKPKIVRLVCKDGTEVSYNATKLKWNKPKTVTVSRGSGSRRHTIVKIVKGKNRKHQVVIVIWYDNGKKDKSADNTTTRNLYTNRTSAS